jgi:carbohydrate-selective porin OprB
VAIQPDLQWIGTPGGGDPSGADDAWIATLRLQIAF